MCGNMDVSEFMKKEVGPLSVEATLLAIYLSRLKRAMGLDSTAPQYERSVKGESAKRVRRW